ncbi:Ig-like domain-containing protein [Flavobacterium sp. 9R]|uniref:Ig-like domain-containing protein n=1 Tax=Flavobacterium sp. 9R TaxID=2653143 RepID=UPI001356DED2|nr:Ig-like domain-containing protein [Flavobacterium sp. 9R]
MKKQYLLVTLLTLCYAFSFSQVTEVEPNNNCQQAVAIKNFIDKGTTTSYSGTITGNESDFWIIPISTASGSMTINLTDQSGGVVGGTYYVVEDGFPAGNTNPCSFRTSAALNSRNPTPFNWPEASSQGKLLYIVLEINNTTGGTAGGDINYTISFTNSSDPLTGTGVPTTPSSTGTEIEPNNDCNTVTVIPGPGLYTGTSDTGSESDFWVFTPKVPGIVYFTIDGLGKDFEWQFEYTEFTAGPQDYCAPFTIVQPDYTSVGAGILKGSGYIVVSDNPGSQDLKTNTPIRFRIYQPDGEAVPYNLFLDFRTPSNPGGVANSKLWLRADAGANANGANLRYWLDQVSPNIYNINGTIGYNTNALNFNPTVSISNTTPAGTIPTNNITGNQPLSVQEAIVVYSQTAGGTLMGDPTASSNKVVFGGNNGDTKTYHSSNVGSQNYINPTTSTFSISQIDYSTTTSQVSINGVPISPINSTGVDFTSIDFTPIIRGTNDSRWGAFNGQIAEIITFQTAITPQEREKLTSYLALKYGISLGNNTNALSYRSSSYAEIWAANATFKYDIFGIGKDTSTGLNQTSSNSINSGSGNGAGQSGKGNIVMNNPSSLDDTDFLLVGHDNGALTEQRTDLPTAFKDSKRLIREWKVKSTGGVGTISLTFNTLGLALSGTTSSDFKLLIDTDGDGDFSNSTVSIDANSFANNVVTFNAVTLPDNAVFTILSKVLIPTGPGVLGASLWLKANEGVTNSGANLTNWVDQTNINTFTNSGTIGFANNAINFNPSVSFNNTDAIGSNPSNRLDGSDNITVIEAFAVYKKQNTTEGGTVLGSITPGSVYGIALFGGVNSNDAWVGNGVYQQYSHFTNSELSSKYGLVDFDVSASAPSKANGYYNGDQQSITDGVGADFSSITFTPRIGGTNNAGTNPIDGWKHFRGEVAEIITYPTALNPTDRLKVSSYLALKYAISLGNNVSTVNYYASDGTIIYPADAVYKYDIFGVGKDSGSGLSQRKSNSINSGLGDGTPISGKGNIILEYPTLADKHFIVIGHNNAPLTTTTANLPPPGTFNMPAATACAVRLNRVWKCEITGTIVSFTLKLSKLGINLPGGVHDFKMITKVANDDFTVSQSGVNNRVRIYNVTLDVNKDELTFTTPQQGLNGVFYFTFLGVDPLPTVPTITDPGSANVCITATLQLSNTTANGIWSSDDATIATVDANGLVTGVSPGKVTIKYTVANSSGCTTIVTKEVTVSPNNTVGTASSSPTLCINSPLNAITHTTTGATGIGVASGIPAGVSAFWNNDTVTISGTPTTSGVFNYSIPLTGGCSSLNATGTITVTALPTKPTISASGPTAFCAPGSVLLTSSAASGNQWYKDSTAISGATAQTYSATDTGAYTVVTTSTNCDSETSDPIVVTANATPSIPIIKAAKSTTACGSDTVTLRTSSPVNKWFKDGNEILGVTSNSYTATASGSYTVEAVNPSGCISGLSTPIVVTINPYPVVNPIVGATTVCAMSSLQLTNTTPNGVWSSDNTGIATVDSNGVVTGVNPGTIAINYTVANSSGCTTVVSQNITVTAKPTKPTILAGGPTTFCAPSTVTLTSSYPTGNQWYQNGAIISGATNQTYSAALTGAYTVVTTLNNCTSDISDPVTVTANPTPTVNPIVGPTIVCAMSTLQLTNATPNGVWSSDNNGIATVDGNGVVTGVNAGTIAINYTFTNSNGCSTKVTQNITVTAKPAQPTISASSPTSFCAPGSVLLTSSAASGNQWYKDGKLITGATNQTYTATDTGAYTVVTTLTNCASDVSNPIVVTANATPSIPVIKAAKSTSACQGDAVTLHTSSPVNKWFKDGNEIQGVTSNAYTATASGIYTVEATNPTGCISGKSTPIVVTIDPYPIVDPIIGATTICAMSTLQLTNATPNGVWTSDNSGIASVDSNGLVRGVSAGTVGIHYTLANQPSGCATEITEYVTVTALPTKPSISAGGSTAFCAPGSVLLTSSAATGNQWYKDSIAISGATAATYIATDTGAYTVVTTLNNCASDQSNPIVVTANATPSIPIIKAAKSTTACGSDTVTLHTSSPVNKWFKDGNEIIGVTSNSYTATASGSYTVEAVNTSGCISGFSTPIIVTINPYPVVDPIVGANTVCALSTLQLTNATVAGVWSSDNTGIATVDSNGVVTGVNPGTIAINYTVANSSGCTTVVSQNITVTAKPTKPTISAGGPTNFCAPGSVTLTSSNPTGNQWYKDGSLIAGATAATYIATNTGTYTLVNTISNCGSDLSDPVTVTANPTPVLNPIAGPTIVCAKSKTQLTNTTPNGVWSSDNNSIASIDGYGFVTGVNAGTVAINYTFTNSNGCSTKVTQNITVTAKPAQPTISAGGPTAFCAPGSVILTSSAASGNQWYKDSVAISGATNQTYSATDTGVYTVVTTLTNCASDVSSPIVVTANATPSIPVIKAAKSTSACQGDTVTLHTSSPTNKWFKDGNEIQGVTSNAYTATASGIYTVEAVNPTGCISGFSTPIVVTIAPYPVVDPIIGATTICAMSTLQLTNATAAGVWSSNNTGIASVDGNGLVTGVNPGTVAINYTLANSSGCTTVVTQNITVTAKPTKPTISAGGSTAFCTPGNVSLTSSYSNGNQWYKDGIAISGATAATFIATDTGAYTVVTTLTNCVSDESDPTVVAANATPSIPIIKVAKSTTACGSDTVTLHTSSPVNKWFKDGNEIIGVTSNSYTATASGSYTVEAVNTSGCISGFSTPIIVTINPYPVVDPIVGANTVCALSTLQLTNATVAGVWSSDNTGIATVDSNGVVTGVNPGTIAINYTVANSSGCTTVVSQNITVTAKPTKPTISAGGPTNFCAPGSVTLTSSNPTGNQWYKDGSPIAGATAATFNATNTGTYTLVNTISNCGSDVSDPVTVTANPTPVLESITGNSSINIGTTTQLANSTKGGVWSSADNTIATVSSNGLVSGIATGDVLISYTVTNTFGCSSVQTILVKVNSFTLLIIDDDFTNNPINSSKGDSLDVLSNDKLNNLPIPISKVSVTISDSNGLSGLTVDNLGRIIIPIGAPIGNYTITYTVCDILNPNNCSSAILKVVIKDSCDFDDSTTSCDILVHNAMSPNNDNYNDLFIIERIENYPNNSVEIYDRYGKPVFRIEGYNNNSKVFKGLSNGPITIDRDDYLPNGTYYYVIKYFKPISGVTNQKAGYLYISR